MATNKDFPEAPPRAMEQRTVRVQLEEVNTIEVPCDPRDPDSARWFDTGTGMHPLRTQSKVTALVGGPETFAAMARAIESANSSDHYIYLLNWWAELDVVLAPGRAAVGGAASTSVIDYLTNAVTLGVQVRAMFWDGVGKQNTSEVALVNALDNAAIAGANGAAVLDNNTLNLGSHHQKLLIVRGENQLIGFCGGVDLNTDRVSAIVRQAGSPMHDVHCQIEGPAAFDLLLIFLDRWDDHPKSVSLNTTKGTLRGESEIIPGPKGNHFVQMGRTYGNGSAHAGITNRFGTHRYHFAPTGETTARSMIHHAILQAHRFIYIEDQYLVDMDTSNLLLAMLPSILRLVILIPHPSISDHPHIWTMCGRFVRNLGTDPKISICYLKPAGAAATPASLAANLPGTYVHSKIWVIDDKFAIIGSANCGMRSYTHDSEVVAGIFDESRDDICTVHFAHDLRMRLWAQHLNLTKSDVFDPIGSAAHWSSPPLSASIAVFDPAAAVDNPRAPQNLFVSEAMAEPDGR
jgi:phosphatidylserine/phosphatidylglycerophosphate/cardiolipin synthase-like enzyme